MRENRGYICILTIREPSNEAVMQGMEREKGIEPSPQAWEARVLPLNYSRSEFSRHRVALGFGCAQQHVTAAILLFPPFFRVQGTVRRVRPSC
jgi:hypothetical protein